MRSNTHKQKVDFFKRLARGLGTNDFESALAKIKKTECAVGMQYDPKTGKLDPETNNTSTIEMMKDSSYSLRERLINGFDKVIQDLVESGFFKKTPNSPLEAMNEMIDRGLGVDPYVYLFINRMDKTASKNFKTTHWGNVNATVIDTGNGLSADEFDSTILSIRSKLKAKELYTFGHHNVGGSTTFKFARYTLIASIKKGSDEIAFTVIYKTKHAGWATHTYVRIGDPDNNGLPFVIKVSDLPQDMISRPNNISSKNLKDSESKKPGKRRIILPEHGTVVKHIGYQSTNQTLFSDTKIRTQGYYNFIKTALFGLPLKVGYADSRSSRPKRENPAGLKHTLAAQSKTYDYVNTFTSINVEPYGNMDVNIWIKKKTYAKNDDDFANYKLINKRSPVLFTYRGQCMGQMRNKDILDSADLSYLDGSMIVEVSCDNIDDSGVMFTSTRESVDGTAERAVKKMLVDCFKNVDALIELNDKIWRDETKNSTSASSAAISEKFAKFAESSATFGALMQQLKAGKIPVCGDDTKSGTCATLVAKKHPHPPKPIDLLDPPTDLGITSSAINPKNTEEWIRVWCNAEDSYNDNFVVEVDSKYYEMTSTAINLKNGRKMVKIKRKAGVKAVDINGKTITIKVKLIDLATMKPLMYNGSMLVRDKDLIIYTPKETVPRKPSIDGNPSDETVPYLSFPEVTFTTVSGPDDKNWSKLDAGDIETSGKTKKARNAYLNSKVAYSYKANERLGTIEVVVNTEYDQLDAAKNKVSSRLKNKKKGETFFTECYNSYAIPVLCDLYGDSVEDMVDGDHTKMHSFRTQHATNVIFLNEMMLEKK